MCYNVNRHYNLPNGIQSGACISEGYGIMEYQNPKDVNNMAMKNAVEVVVDGRVYKISGYESQEYLHQIAVYINEKMTECHNTENYRKQSSDQRQLMLSMNLADDYFKAKNRAEKLTAELEKKERELYSVRHDLIEAQLELENLRKEKKAGSGQNNRRNDQHTGKQNNAVNNTNSSNGGINSNNTNHSSNSNNTDDANHNNAVNNGNQKNGNNTQR